MAAGVAPIGGAKPWAHNDPAIDVAVNADSTGNVHAHRMFIAQSPQLQMVRARLFSLPAAGGSRSRPIAFPRGKRRFPARYRQLPVGNALRGVPHAPG